MYANHYGSASPQPSLSNNPFVEDSTTAHARFPDLSASTFQPGYHSNGYPNQPQQYPSQFQQYAYGTGGPYQSQPQAVPPHNQFASSSFTSQYQPQTQGQSGPQPTGFGAFQPANGFAQPPQQYPIQSNHPYSGGGYPQQPPSTNTTPSYLAEFDPYALQSHSQQPRSPSQSTSQSTSGNAPPGMTHPRDLIRTLKSGLEAWDVFSWKQLLGACDALKEAWAVRKQQAESVVHQYGGPDPGLFGPDPAFGYNSQVEGWKQVLKDAKDNFDTVAACTFQLQEVFRSYRQSGDPASKRRVRESCNAAVKGLPDWPGN